MSLPPLFLEIALPVFLATVLLVLGLWRLAYPVRSEVDTRLAALRPEAAARRRPLARWGQLGTVWAEQIGSRVGWKRGGAMEQTLRHAGFRSASALLVLRTLQLAIALLGVGGALVWIQTTRPPATLAIAATCLWGYVLLTLPAVAVRLRANERQRRIAEGLPGVLDLVVVCLEAGLGLDAALIRVAAEISSRNPILGGELLTVSREVQAGIPRREALRNLSERTGVPEVAALVAILAQTERLGTSISRALRTQADTARTQRRQQVEEQAAKTAVKIVFPLAFCIFPALFLVVLGPALIGVARLFTEMGR
ncbi:MAG: type II secretion system F family protein [Candidatus Eiseniibacteriota bacterium]|jgi:tight adherence protein C